MQFLARALLAPGTAFCEGTGGGSLGFAKEVDSVNLELSSLDCWSSLLQTLGGVHCCKRRASRVREQSSLLCSGSLLKVVSECLDKCLDKSSIDGDPTLVAAIL